MMPERMLPENPLEFIRRCITQRKIHWTYHVNMRLKGRFIPREAIVGSIENFEIIEEYPKLNIFRVILYIRSTGT